MKKIVFLALSLAFSMSFANTKAPAQTTVKETSAKAKKAGPEGPLNRYTFYGSNGVYYIYAYSYEEAKAKAVKEVISQDMGTSTQQGPVYGG